MAHAPCEHEPRRHLTSLLSLLLIFGACCLLGVHARSPERFGINDQRKWFRTVIGRGGVCLGASVCLQRSSIRLPLFPALPARVIASESITNCPEASVIKKARTNVKKKKRRAQAPPRTRLMKLSFRTRAARTTRERVCRERRITARHPLRRTSFALISN